MSDPRSRYSGLPVLLLDTPAGTIACSGRRVVPTPSVDPAAAVVVVRPGERIDLVAARALGDATLSWRLADVNSAMELIGLAEPGRVLRLPGAGS